MCDAFKLYTQSHCYANKSCEDIITWPQRFSSIFANNNRRKKLCFLFSHQYKGLFVIIDFKA